MKLFKANLIDNLSCFEYETHADAGDLKVWIEGLLQEVIERIDFKGNEAIFWLNDYDFRVTKPNTIVVFIACDIKVYSKSDFELQYRVVKEVGNEVL